jgi:phage-related protein
MPASITIADAIDKNKIASANVWLVLLDIDIISPDTGELIETRRFVKNNEPIPYRGNLYEPTDFDFDQNKELNSEPSLKLTVFDPTNSIRGAMEDYGGGIGFAVTMSVVNSGNLGARPELAEEFIVTEATAPDVAVTFTLGAENPLKAEFPHRRQYRDRCPWPYKGRRCGYSGALATCDYTLSGANGCRAHSNVARFGGFPGLKNRQS